MCHTHSSHSPCICQQTPPPNRLLLQIRPCLGALCVLGSECRIRPTFVLVWNGRYKTVHRLTGEPIVYGWKCIYEAMLGLTQAAVEKHLFMLTRGRRTLLCVSVFLALFVCTSKRRHYVVSHFTLRCCARLESVRNRFKNTRTHLRQGYAVVEA